ncbi:hypothetical protein [Pseudonocardia sp.]|uniref:hypothetical protein n=1 Tax=Pseudonocardia sp. TaxID=60912 RepID=UPI002618DAE7|nr:hypothetical protein [Pseudonocardia sp.]
MSRTASLLTGALVGALALTGCGAGQISGTAEQVAAVSGANVGSGPIVVRDAVIEFGEQVAGDVVHARGSDAPLSMTIVNEGAEADRLVSATSVWASEVRISGATAIPAGRAVVVQGVPPAPPVEEPDSEDSSVTPTPTPAPTVAPAGGTQVVLAGLVDDLRSGLTYELVLTFERAGEITMRVPVGSTEEPREAEPVE